jgi:hypothetical protein
LFEEPKGNPAKQSPPKQVPNKQRQPEMAAKERVRITEEQEGHPKFEVRRGIGEHVDAIVRVHDRSRAERGQFADKQVQVKIGSEDGR